MTREWPFLEASMSLLAAVLAIQAVDPVFSLGYAILSVSLMIAAGAALCEIWLRRRVK